jgi:hypothetical protein
VARIRNLRFDSWRDFKRDIVAELFPGESQHRRGVYLFRGMQSPRWRLEPSFDRAFGDVPAAGTSACLPTSATTTTA